MDEAVAVHGVALAWGLPCTINLCGYTIFDSDRFISVLHGCVRLLPLSLTLALPKVLMLYSHCPLNCILSFMLIVGDLMILLLCYCYYCSSTKAGNHTDIFTMSF